MVWHARVCAGSGDDSDDDGDDDGDDDYYDDDVEGDDDDVGDDDDDDRAGDDDDACLSCDFLIPRSLPEVVLLSPRSHTLPLGKQYVPSTPKSCFSHPEAILGWKPTYVRTASKTQCNVIV